MRTALRSISCQQARARWAAPLRWGRQVPLTNSKILRERDKALDYPPLSNRRLSMVRPIHLVNLSTRGSLLSMGKIQIDGLVQAT